MAEHPDDLERTTFYNRLRWGKFRQIGLKTLLMKLNDLKIKTWGHLKCVFKSACLKTCYLDIFPTSPRFPIFSPFQLISFSYFCPHVYKVS